MDYFYHTWFTIFGIVMIPLFLWIVIVHFSKNQTQANINHKIYKGIQSEEYDSSY